MEYVTSGKVEGGTLILRGKKRMDVELGRWRDTEVVVTIKKAQATRSALQNAYYFGVVVKLLSDHTGFSPLETHEVLKAQHLPRELAANGENGRLMGDYVIGGSTSKLDKLQFIAYLEAIVTWAAETLNVVIPDPDPEWREKAQAEHDARLQSFTAPAKKGAA